MPESININEEIHHIYTIRLFHFVLCTFLWLLLLLLLLLYFHRNPFQLLIFCARCEYGFHCVSTGYFVIITFIFSVTNTLWNRFLALLYIQTFFQCVSSVPLTRTSANHPCAESLQLNFHTNPVWCKKLYVLFLPFVTC